MCLAIPMQLIERGEFEGLVELRGVRRKISLMLFPDAEVGDHLLVHAGYAITRIDEDEARETVALLEQMALEDGVLESSIAEATGGLPLPEAGPGSRAATVGEADPTPAGPGRTP